MKLTQALRKKSAEPRRGNSGRGSCAGTKKKTRGKQDNCDKTTPNPMRNQHRRSRAANLSQPAGEPQKGRQLHDTEWNNRRCTHQPPWLLILRHGSQVGHTGSPSLLSLNLLFILQVSILSEQMVFCVS